LPRPWGRTFCGVPGREEVHDGPPETDAASRFPAGYERLLSLLPEELRQIDGPLPDEQNAYGPWRRALEEAVDPWPESLDGSRILGSLMRAFTDDPVEEWVLPGVAVPDDAAVRRAR
jgi:hypothetical protein